jgi:hypothetical protein
MSISGLPEKGSSANLREWILMHLNEKGIFEAIGDNSRINFLGK